jgi:hypothetical protein
MMWAVVFWSAAAPSGHAVELTPVARYATGIFDKSAAEIVAYDAAGRRLFVTNAASRTVDILRLARDVAGRPALVKAGALALDPAQAPTSVAVQDGLVAVAVHNPDAAGKPGRILLFSSSGKRLASLAAGALPDMVTFTPDGQFILAANEGEPESAPEGAPEGALDPKGSITIITLGHGAGRASAAQAVTVGFDNFTAAALKARGVRLFPGRTPARDLEPEYITIAPDSATAWISLQENNALARLDIRGKKITAIYGLGLKNHARPGQGLDPNDKDGPHIAPHPVWGMYMPDGIATYRVKGQDYIVSANEGDARDEDVKLARARLDPGTMSAEERRALGRLHISSIDGDVDGDGDIDRPQSYGARSFSIWSGDGRLVFDSGDDFEQRLARRHGDQFNADNDKPHSGDKRSDNKGPEPEGVVLGALGGRTYAFIGLERDSGIMVYDVSDPHAPVFAAYAATRNFSSELAYDTPIGLARAGDLGPEGLAFIAPADSPYGAALLVVANEVSGSVTLYSFKQD